MKIFKFFLAGLMGLSIIGGAALGYWYFQDAPITSPLTELSRFNFFSKNIPSSSDKTVYGFLPYWNLAEFEWQPELTHLVYFGLTIDGDGQILTRETAGNLEPGYARLQSETWLTVINQAQKNNQQIELVLSQFDDDTIEQFLQNPQAAVNFLKTLDSLILAYPISGINLDIEYSSNATSNLRQQYTNLIGIISEHIDKKYPNINLSIDIYPSAYKPNQLWDLAQLEPLVDQIIVMAYDFHQRSSAQAGPVAPLFGGRKYWDADINQSLANLIKVIPPHKILLGVPFYGYEWQTTSRDPQAHTFPQTGSTASIKRVNQLRSQSQTLNVKEGWNEEALSPFLSYLKDDQTYVIYYENSDSISYKLDYVNQLNLGGIAIWALGYEGSSRELWEVISKKL